MKNERLGKNRIVQGMQTESKVDVNGVLPRFLHADDLLNRKKRVLRANCTRDRSAGHSQPVLLSENPY